MKEKYVTDLLTGEEFISYFMIKQIALKTGSNRKTYLDVTLGDKTGEISAKKWDVADEEQEGLSRYKVGDVIKVAATVTEWNGMQQLRLIKLRMTGAEDGIDITDYIKAAPEKPEDMFAFIREQAMAIGDEDLKRLCLKNLDDNKEKFMYYPAASKNHHAERSGLLWHIKRMLMSGLALCDVYTFLNKDLLVTGIILHDIEKLTEIESDENGISPGYSFEGIMLGHIVQGVKLLEVQMNELGFPYEKKIMIEHMILAHHCEPEYGSPRRPLFPEAEMLHHLDNMDAKMYDMEDALEGTKPGEFSDSVWTLDRRRLYKASDGE